MKKSLSLSLVIPVYNEEHHLKACLDAIAGQTEMPNEVIVVDNNSTDGSQDIALGYSFVKLVHESKPGVLAARNKGFSVAKSDIIGRIDADTILTPNWCKHVKARFASSDVAALTGPTYWYDMPFAPHNYHLDNVLRSSLFYLPKDFPWLFGTNMAVRASAWKTIKKELCEDKRVFEDLDIGIHLDRHGFSIGYSRKMRVGMSSRRYDDSPKDFFDYISTYKSSYSAHNMNPMGSSIAAAIYSFGYFALWPLRQSYDDRTKTRSIKHLFSGRNKARKNPMV